jgi:hypothetical protein
MDKIGRLSMLGRRLCLISAPVWCSDLCLWLLARDTIDYRSRSACKQLPLICFERVQIDCRSRRPCKPLQLIWFESPLPLFRTPNIY